MWGLFKDCAASKINLFDHIFPVNQSCKDNFLLLTRSSTLHTVGFSPTLGMPLSHQGTPPYLVLGFAGHDCIPSWKLFDTTVREAFSSDMQM